MCFIDIIRINYTRSYNIQSFPHPAVSCGTSVGEKEIFGCDCSFPRVDVKTGLWQYNDSNQEVIRDQYQ